MNDSFLTELADMPTAEQLKFLAVAAGAIIREAAEDPDQARDAVDRLLILIARAAGRRL